MQAAGWISASAPACTGRRRHRKGKLTVRSQTERASLPSIAEGAIEERRCSPGRVPPSPRRPPASPRRPATSLAPARPSRRNLRAASRPPRSLSSRSKADRLGRPSLPASEKSERQRQGRRSVAAPAPVEPPDRPSCGVVVVQSVPDQRGPALRRTSSSIENPAPFRMRPARPRRPGRAMTRRCSLLVRCRTVYHRLWADWQPAWEIWGSSAAFERQPQSGG
jgi:hypothetical protein